jgi:hypothetical protein
MRVLVTAIAGASLFAACGSGRPEPVARTGGALAAPSSLPAAPDGLTDPATWARWERADYVMLAPHGLAPALEPLARFREADGHVVALLEIEPLFAKKSGGNPDPRVLVDVLRTLDTHAHGKLRYVLLAGDVQHPGDPPPADTPLPTFYLPKLDYDHHTPKDRQNPIVVPQDERSSFPSDDPYALARGPARLAVGRVPAHDAAELSAFVKKVLAYEGTEGNAEQAWRRRVTVFAGAANFGPQADALIESMSEDMLDRELSYDYDLRFTFAKYGSPYAYRLDRLEAKMVSDMDDGALLAAYIGHGAVSRFAPADFRGYDYEVGTADDAAAMRIPAGKPLFFSIACDTGAFDRPQGEVSIAERMVLNPDGPIAVFASSRESHPYPNALYGLAIIQRFLDHHAATVGDGIVEIKQSMREDSLGVAELLIDVDIDALKKEHQGLYNLFGDPATRLRYAEGVHVTAPTGGVRPGATFSVDFDATASGGGGGPASGLAVVTLETQRDVLRPGIATRAELDRMAPEAALARMEENSRLANDKVLSRVEQPLGGGHARANLTAPVAPGDYVIKVLVEGEGGGTAAGHAGVRVVAAAAPAP